MKSYSFDIGDSGKGPIGAVIRVTAKDEDEAVQHANFALDKLFAGQGPRISVSGLPGVEYFNLYVNDTFRFSTADVGDVEDAG